MESKSLPRLTPHVSLANWGYMPYKRSLSRIWLLGMMRRARNVRTLACDIQHTLQSIHSNRQHLSVQPGANACWALASEMDTILSALSDTQDTTSRHATSTGKLHAQ